MSLSEGHKANFNTMLRAAANRDLALMDCTDTTTGKPVAVVCMVERGEGDYNFVPVARLFDGNPYEEVDPPK